MLRPRSGFRAWLVVLGAAAPGLAPQGALRLASGFSVASRKDCWRPTVDDVDRISWGKPAKKKVPDQVRKADCKPKPNPDADPNLTP
mmetsp:Transcript_32915/g.104225  ORF Transcript_32915/g.104225 Transcript_32915/m.104225 type:complete len:87 (-) Transcript_32915:620-880(-)